MSAASMQLKMLHVCTIERDANAGDTDGWGTSAPPNWQPHLTNQKCRHQSSAGRELVANTTTAVVVEDMRLILPLGTDVTEQDRLGDVTYRDATIAAGPTGIRSVLTHQDHIELVLVRLA